MIHKSFYYKKYVYHLSNGRKANQKVDKSG